MKILLGGAPGAAGPPGQNLLWPFWGLRHRPKSMKKRSKILMSFWSRFWCLLGPSWPPFWGSFGAFGAPKWAQVGSQKCLGRVLGSKTRLFKTTTFSYAKPHILASWGSPRRAKSSPKRVQDPPKTVPKGLLLSYKIFIDFGTLLGPLLSSQEVPKSTPRGSQEGPEIEEKMMRF